MEITFYCGKCGAKLVVDAARAEWEVVCPQCHSHERAPRQLPSFKRHCLKCNAQMATDAILCIQCGWDARTNEMAASELNPTYVVAHQRRARMIALVAVMLLLLIAAAVLWFWLLRPAS